MSVVLQFLVRVCVKMTNLGLATGLMFGALLLARPILKRILTPQQRVVLWAVGWMPAYLISWYGTMHWIHLLPVTFRDLITPRLEYGTTNHVPMYLPEFDAISGACNVALPGGVAVQVDVQPVLVWAAALVWLIGVVLALFWIWRGEVRLRGLLARGEAVPEEAEWLQRIPELQERSVQVRLYDQLPTSFVTRFRAKGVSDEIIGTICLQRELSLEQRELVVRHELSHIRLWHCYFKQFSTCAMVFHWWNPMMWLGNRYFCLDLELASDRATLEKLDPAQRKAYAKTLVEAAAGKQMWSEPLCFGESDAAVRVKEIVSWKKLPLWKRLPGLAAFVLLVLFFLGGPENRVLTEDLLLAWQRQGGTAQSLVAAMEHMAAEADRLPEGVRIEELWLETEDVSAAGFFRLYAKGSDGNWVSLFGNLRSDGSLCLNSAITNTAPPPEGASRLNL